MSKNQLESKEVILTKNPEKHKNGKEWWAIHYSPKHWLKCHPNNSFYYTSVTKRTCPEVEDLKKGDKIFVTIKNQRVVKVSINGSER